MPPVATCEGSGLNNSGPNIRQKKTLPLGDSLLRQMPRLADIRS